MKSRENRNRVGNPKPSLILKDPPGGEILSKVLEQDDALIIISRAR
jgi:hypothetical protein